MILMMGKENIKFQIELEQYAFELKYGKDFKGVIIWLAGSIGLLAEGLFSGRFSLISMQTVELIIVGLTLVLMGFALMYLYKRKNFLEDLQTLRKKYEDGSSYN